MVKVAKGVRVEINNGVLDKYDQVLADTAKESVLQVPVMMQEINRRFNDKLSYEFLINDGKNIVLSIVAYRTAMTKKDSKGLSRKIVYRAKGNFIFDGQNFIEDGALKGILVGSKLDFHNIDPKLMIKELHRMDIKMYIDENDPLIKGKNITRDQLNNLSEDMVEKRPIFDMYYDKFDMKVEILSTEIEE